MCTDTDPDGSDVAGAAEAVALVDEGAVGLGEPLAGVQATRPMTSPAPTNRVRLCIASN